MSKTTVTSSKTLTWDNTIPGEYRWLTAADILVIADQIVTYGIDLDSFIYIRPEYAEPDDTARLRVDELLIKDDEVLNG